MIVTEIEAKDRKHKRIIRLANKLLQALIDNGYDVKTHHASNFISVYINAFKCYDKEIIYVEKLRNDWAIKGEYTGTGFQGVEE